MTKTNKDKSKIFEQYTKEELLNLPCREWKEETSGVFDSILVFPTKRKHFSGWRCMAIIGVRKGIPIEKLTTGADDLNWKITCQSDFRLHTDCCMKTGVFHYWGNDISFEVSTPYSSFDIKVISRVISKKE
jgi:hypothetical protein